MSRTPALMPPAKVVAPERRQDGVLDDQLGHQVGELRLEPAADLDAHLAVAGRDDQDHAVVLVLLADRPRPPEAVAEVLDRIALQRARGVDRRAGRWISPPAPSAPASSARLSSADSSAASSTMRPVSGGNLGSRGRGWQSPALRNRSRTQQCHCVRRNSDVSERRRASPSPLWGGVGGGGNPRGATLLAMTSEQSAVVRLDKPHPCLFTPPLTPPHHHAEGVSSTRREGNRVGAC